MEATAIETPPRRRRSDDRALRQVHRSIQAHPLGHRPRRDPRSPIRLRQEVHARRPVEDDGARRSSRRPRGASCRRSRAAPTPTCSAWSNATSAPRPSSSPAHHWLGDQVALEALVRMTDEELKHQELFRRLERMAATACPPATTSCPQPNDGRRRRAQQVDLGGARADARHRALHARALPLEHRARRRPVRAVEGRVPVPLEGRVAARDPRRARMAARGRAAERGRARPGRDRPDRARRRRSTASCRCRPRPMPTTSSHAGRDLRPAEQAAIARH